MRHIHTEGIILHKKAYGEGHELAFIYTKALGKLKVKAKGSRKIKSKFLGHLETLNICKIQLYNGPHTMLITECEAIHPFRYEKLSAEHTNYGIKLAKLIDSCILEQEQDSNLYQIIEQAIKDLQSTQKPFLSFLKTTTKLIKHLGHFAEFSKTCPSCLKELEKTEASYLDERDQVICQECAPKNERLLELDSKYRNFLGYINKLEDRQEAKLKVTEKEEQILNKLSEAFLQSSRHY